MNVQICVTIPQ